MSHQDRLTAAFDQVKKDVAMLTNPKTYQNMSQNQIITGLTVMLLVVGVATGVYLGGQGQDVRQQASSAYPQCGAGSQFSCVGANAGDSCQGNGRCFNTETNANCTCQTTCANPSASSLCNGAGFGSSCTLSNGSIGVCNPLTSLSNSCGCTVVATPVPGQCAPEQIEFSSPSACSSSCTGSLFDGNVHENDVQCIPKIGGTSDQAVCCQNIDYCPWDSQAGRSFLDGDRSGCEAVCGNLSNPVCVRSVLGESRWCCPQGGGSGATSTPVPPTNVPPTNVPPTNVPPTNVPPTNVPPTVTPGGPTLTPTNTPVVGPVCANVTVNNPGSNNSTPQVGDAVTLTCGLVAGAHHYEFSIQVPGAANPTLISPVSLTSNVSVQIQINQQGQWIARCRPCDVNNVCSPWE